MMLPRQSIPIAEAGGRTSEPFYRFLQDLERAVRAKGGDTAELQRQIDKLREDIAEGRGDIGLLLGSQSVRVVGQLSNGNAFVSLQGDVDAPGPTFVYGTNAAGEKGWFALADGLLEGDGVALSVDAKGRVTFGLAPLPDTGGGTLQKTARDQYGRVSGTSEATTDDLPEGSNLYFTDERVDARITAQKGQPGGLATLDANAKLDAGQLPALAITETFVVSTEAAMLALDVQQGDVAVRSDLQASFILTAEPASTLSNWQELLVPTGVGVASFNGRTGSVVPASGDYTAAQVGADPAGTAASAVTAHEAEPDPHPQYATADEAAAAAPVQSVNGKQGAVTLTAADVGAVSEIGNATIKAAGDPFVLTLEGYGDSNANIFRFRKSRGSAVDQNVSVAAGDELLALRSEGADGAGGWIGGGRIAITTTGAPSGGGVPTRISFYTTDPVEGNGTRWHIMNAGTLQPAQDDRFDLGASFARVRQIYAVNGAINTSDARQKTEPRDLTEAELAAAADIARLPCIFQWLHAIEEKGEDARLHSSPTVQSVIAAMEAHGLDPFRYGFVCFDQWDEQPEIRDEWPDEYDDEGNLIREAGSEVTQEYRPAGDRYSLRPSELAHFVLRGLAHRQDELERRLAALESQ